MQTWMSPTDAAAAMSCSVRTVQRRVAAGELEARTTDDGRREILVDDDTMTDARRPVGTDAGAVVVAQHDRALALAERVTGVGQVTADHLAEQARSARRMVAVVGVTLAAVVSASVAWAGYSAWRIGTTDAQLAAAVDDADDARRDADALRVALDDAREREAELAEQAAVSRAEREAAAARVAELARELERERERIDSMLMTARPSPLSPLAHGPHR